MASQSKFILSPSVSVLSSLVEQLSLKFRSTTMAVPCMIKKEEEKALKPKTKSLKTRVRRIKADMGMIREEQRCIREEQRSIGERFGDVKQQCDELRSEMETILQKSAFNRIRLGIMFSILRARRDGDFDKAAAFSGLLTSISDTRNL